MRHYFPLGILTLIVMIPVVSFAQTVTIEPDKDNTLYEDSNGSLSNGVGIYLFTGKTNSGDLRRALLHFDVASSIPAGATITGATLTMTMNKTISGGQSTSLHAVTQDWGEGTSNAPGQEGAGAPSTTNDATWIHTFFSSTNWNTAGGDFNATPSATASVAGNGTYDWTDPQMVSDVQAWLDQDSTNFGWIVIGNEGPNGTAKRFGSRDGVAASRPKLNITYSPPCVDPELPMLSATSSAVCPGEPSTIIVNGNFNSATAWYLYSGSCGGTLLDSTQAGILGVAPTSSTTYYIRGEGGCVTPGVCDSITISVLPIEDASFSYPSNGAFCEGAPVQLPTISGTSGGAFSATPAGLSLDPVSGEIDPAQSSTGTYAVQYITPGIDCPDTSILDVIIHPNQHVLDTLQICSGDSVLFDGQFIKTAGDYTATFASSAGCDSTVTLTLELITSFDMSNSVQICVGDTIMLGSQMITQPGDYTEAFVTNAGCDSTVNLSVSVVEVNVSVNQQDSVLEAAAVDARFQWINCADNQPIADETASQFIPEESGEYAVIVEQSGCSDTSDCVQVDIVNSIGDANSLSVRVFPNPASSVVSVSAESSFRDIRVKVLNIQGQTLLSETGVNTSSLDLNLSRLPAGLYLVEVEADGQRGIVRMLKE